MTPAEKPRLTDKNFLLVWWVKNAMQLPIPVLSPKEGKVIVEGFNVVTKHVKPTRMGQVGGIVETESAIYADKVQLVCPKCDQPTRVGHVVEDGKKLRVCKKCGKSFE